MAGDRRPHAEGYRPLALRCRPHRRRRASSRVRLPHARLLGRWACLALLLLAGGAVAQSFESGSTVPPVSTVLHEPITPIPAPPPADPLKLALGESLFKDRRLSHDGSLACLTCHDIRFNGADDGRRTTARDGSKMLFRVLSVFNASLSFRLNWEGNYRTLEAQTQSSLENPANMGTSVEEVLAKLNADPEMVRQFNDAYGHAPDRVSLLDAIATFERSLLTPDSRFDHWLTGDVTA
ncbi:MAG: cytochrome-c peroxidase, partial [Alphaproteobacteria bacterium]|nr:cytochrome-c peroxidase [Alphaproteobacteria bacterium]